LTYPGILLKWVQKLESSKGMGKERKKPGKMGQKALPPSITNEMAKEAVRKIDTRGIKPEVRQRTKGKPITVTSSLDFNTIKLTVKASPEDWQGLERLFWDAPEQLAEDLHSYFIVEALEKTVGKERRGSPLVRQIQFCAGWLYAFLSYWCKKPLEDWPLYLQRLIQMIEEKGNGIFVKTSRGRYGARELTLYCTEKIYGDAAAKYGLSPFSDPNNFYITYALADGKPAEIREKYLTNKTPQEVERLPFELPQLKYILRTLKVI